MFGNMNNFGNPNSVGSSLRNAYMPMLKNAESKSTGSIFTPKNKNAGELSDFFGSQNNSIQKRNPEIPVKPEIPSDQDDFGRSDVPENNDAPFRPENQNNMPSKDAAAILNSAKTKFGCGKIAYSSDGVIGHGCYGGVKRSIADATGVHLSGTSAYMAADQLAQSGKFKELKNVDKTDLKNLPAGAVVVWDRGGKHKDGHISVADGQGGEYSDMYRKQTENYGTSFRVFASNDMQTPYDTKTA